MKTLVATFGDGDLENTLLAMRRLPYDRLVLIGPGGDEEPSGLEELRRLESMSGHDVVFEPVPTTGFMDMVDEVSEIISKLGVLGHGHDELVLSIGGGTKLMADAALFAAFRMGVPAYHVSDKVVRLPVMKGITAKTRFTELQMKFIKSLEGPRTLEEVIHALRPQSKQSVERIMRELKKMGLVAAALEYGKVVISLTDDGGEVRRALDVSQ